MKDYEESRICNSIQQLHDLDGFSSRNVRDVQKIVRKMKLDQAEPETVRSFLSCMKRVAPLVDFDLRDASREHIEDLAMSINQESDSRYGPEWGSYAAWTHADDKAAVQTFFKYLDCRDHEHLFRDVRLTPKAADRPALDPEELIDAREAEQLISSVSHARDRAFLGLLWDSGMRRKEIASLEWRDVVPMEDGLVKIHVREGKNGPRNIFIFESVPLVTAWMDKFPDPQPGDSLWIAKRGWSKQKQGIQPRSLSNIVESARRDAGIPERRRTNLHAWRKARATDMAAKGMNQPAMEEYFGWCSGSRMPRIYIKLAEVDLENQVRDIYGLDRKRKQQKFIGDNLEEYQDRKSSKRKVMA